jgi:hypothetical protein
MKEKNEREKWMDGRIEHKMAHSNSLFGAAKFPDTVQKFP